MVRKQKSKLLYSLKPNVSVQDNTNWLETAEISNVQLFHNEIHYWFFVKEQIKMKLQQKKK